MDQATLYEDDIEAWAEAQVAALRRLAAGPGGWSNAIDWDNVIEEIESLGGRDRQAVESLLGNALAHLLKIWADPGSLSARHWRVEVEAFLGQVRAKMRPGMRRRLDLDAIWGDAVARAALSLGAYDRGFPAPVPDRCPCTLDALLADPFDLGGALRVLP